MVDEKDLEQHLEDQINKDDPVKPMVDRTREVAQKGADERDAEKKDENA